MRQIISDIDAQEAGIKKEIYQDWTDVMQALWTASIHTYNMLGDVVFPKNEENQIFLGNRWRIDAIMCNNSFVEARLWEGETQLAEIRYTGNVTTICKCLFVIIKDSLE